MAKAFTISIGVKMESLMKVAVDTHTHTLASGHGFCTIREMAIAAKKKGLEAIAITEHGPAMPGSAHLFYFKNFDILPRRWEGFPVLFGAELNIIDGNGNVDLPEFVINLMDITIASIHPECYTDQGSARNTQAYMRIMDRKNIDIIGHPDDGRFPVDYRKLVQYAKETGTLLEVNNASHKPNAYRIGAHNNCLQMLLYCKEMKVPVVLGSDAHVDVGIADTTYSSKVLKEAEFPDELIANTSYEKLMRMLKRNQ